MKPAPTLWIITEGLAGTENQCLGVAEAFRDKYAPDTIPRVLRIKLREPWKSLSPWLGFEQWWSFDPIPAPPWPDILITSGRKAIAAARYIKKWSGGKTFTLHLQDPKIKPDAFDLVAVPRHDSLRGDNVLVTAASPNRITPGRLERAAREFPQMESLPARRAAVLIGGDSRTHKLTRAVAGRLIADLKKIADGTGLMITTSRRTPPFLLEGLKRHFSGPGHYLYSGEGPNPYFALLAQADFIIATNDSASMLSEAATTGKPVYMIGLEGASAKFGRLYQTLKERGALRDFAGTLEKWTYEPLSDAADVADRLYKAFTKKSP